MTSLKLYSDFCSYMIATVYDEDGKIIGSAVCDRQMQKYTTEVFKTPANAMEWAEKNHKEITA